MKNRKKLIALTLAVLIMALAAVACDGGTDMPGDNTPDTQQQPNVNEPDTKETPEATHDPTLDPTPTGALEFSDIRVYDNYITVDVTGGASDDKLDYCIMRKANYDELADKLVFWNYFIAGGVTQRTVTYDDLQADTQYVIGVINLGPSRETRIGYTDPLKIVTTAKLQNLQHCEIYARDTLNFQDRADITEVPEATQDSLSFRIRFYANQDYLARFDVNGDGVVDSADATALENNDIAEPTSTTYYYDGISARDVTVMRGDIDKDGSLTTDDVDRLNELLAAPDVGGVKFYLVKYDDYMSINAPDANIDEYMEQNPQIIVQTMVVDTIPRLDQETVIDVTFTGLEAGTKYTVMTSSQSQKHYQAPWDRHDASSTTLA